MEHIGYFFKLIDNRLKANADAGLSKHGLTFVQSRILRFLAEHGGQAAGFHLRRGSALRRGRLRGGGRGLPGHQLLHRAADQL